MKLKSFMTTMALFATALGLKEVPINAEKKQLELSEEQETLLNERFSAELVAKAKEEINKEIAATVENNLELKANQDEIDAIVKELNLTEEERKNFKENVRGNNEAIQLMKTLDARSKEQEVLLNKILKEGVGDVPAETLTKEMKNVKHSSTHLFASGKEYDKLNRNWNARVVNQSVRATDFSDQVVVNKLNEDLNHYYLENPTEIKSLQFDNFGLPAFWGKRLKVDDQVSDATIATAEITQARKLPWLPKNRQKIEAEIGKIFPIQIDAEWIGFDLQKIEASWLNSMNKEGSQPYKMSFVRFLLGELDKKARIEDRVATIKGIYVPTPEGATVAGNAINRQDGLLHLLQQARDVKKKYLPFDMGLPTSTNIVEYVDRIIKNLPVEIRERQDLVLYLSPDWLRAYKRRFEFEFGTNTDYKGYPTNPKDYPGIKFEPMVDMSGSDFVFITFDDNIEILENVPAEKSMYKFEYAKRVMSIMADYKLGVRIKHIGTSQEAGEPDAFKKQLVWSNTAPIFTFAGEEVYVPLYQTGSTKVTVTHPNIAVSADRTSTITELENAPKNSVVKIKGNVDLVATLNVVHNSGKLALTGNANFDLKTGGTLTLFVPETGVPYEISRTTAPETTPTVAYYYDEAVVDVTEGTEFMFNGGATTAITEILGGVIGKTVKLYGTDASGVDVTFSTVGNVKVNSAVTLGAATHYLQLTNIAGIWTETAKVTA